MLTVNFISCPLLFECRSGCRLHVQEHNSVEDWASWCNTAEFSSAHTHKKKHPYTKGMRHILTNIASINTNIDTSSYVCLMPLCQFSYCTLKSSLVQKQADILHYVFPWQVQSNLFITKSHLPQKYLRYIRYSLQAYTFAVARGLVMFMWKKCKHDASNEQAKGILQISMFRWWLAVPIKM